MVGRAVRTLTYVTPQSIGKMNVNGQLFGREAIREGYTYDSEGLAIVPERIYNYRALVYTEITYLRWVESRSKKIISIQRTKNQNTKP
jgi:hypothetical protein